MNNTMQRLPILLVTLPLSCGSSGLPRSAYGPVAEGYTSPPVSEPSTPQATPTESPRPRTFRIRFSWVPMRCETPPCRPQVIPSGMGVRYAAWLECGSGAQRRPIVVVDNGLVDGPQTEIPWPRDCGNGDTGAEATITGMANPARCEPSYGHMHINLRPGGLVTPVFACFAM